MRFLDLFKTNSTRQFVSEDKFKDNLNMQVELAPETLNHLRNFGVNDDIELKLEFFFYSEKLENGQQLAEELKKLDYEVECGESAGSKRLFLINGWTTKIKMDDHTVQQWAMEMCELGYKFDCEFDGWGTTPDQDSDFFDEIN